MKLFTIGHSNHTLDKFTRLLEDNGVTLLVDVRSTPYSRYHSQFNKESERVLLQQNIGNACRQAIGRAAAANLLQEGALPGED
jgi:uncharacterized protein (DUF488 family)